MQLATTRLWNLAEPIYHKILAHPFLNELSSGSLKQPAFLFYLEQDALYLVEYAKALATLASRATQPAEISLLLDFAKGALVAERDLHERYFQTFNVATAGQELSATCLAYTHYLRATVQHAPLDVAMTSLLPCFWIYHEVGKQLVARPKAPQNPYQAWIDMYGGAEFETVVQQAIQLTDHYATTMGTPHSQLEQAFLNSTRFEWMFWDSAYRLEFWALEV